MNIKTFYFEHTKFKWGVVVKTGKLWEVTFPRHYFNFMVIDREAALFCKYIY